jgi:hypothetical protein
MMTFMEPPPRAGFVGGQYAAPQTWNHAPAVAVSIRSCNGDGLSFELGDATAHCHIPEHPWSGLVTRRPINRRRLPCGRRPDRRESP